MGLVTAGHLVSCFATPGHGIPILSLSPVTTLAGETPSLSWVLASVLPMQEVCGVASQHPGLSPACFLLHGSPSKYITGLFKILQVLLCILSLMGSWTTLLARGSNVFVSMPTAAPWDHPVCKNFGSGGYLVGS